MRQPMTQQILVHGLPLVLLGAACWIWQTSLTFQELPGDSLLLLAGIPLAIWCGAPWRCNASPERPNLGTLGAASLLLFLGSTIQSVLLMALAWTGLFNSWTRLAFNQSKRSRQAASYLAFLSFPWLAIEGIGIGWWFRETGAQAGAHVFKLTGFQVDRHGSTMVIDQLPVEVTEACSGMQTLQVFLLAGGILAFLESSSARCQLWALFMLPLAAWLANGVRLILVTISGLTFGVDAASGALHEWLGLVSSVSILLIYRSGIKVLNTLSFRFTTERQQLLNSSP